MAKQNHRRPDPAAPWLGYGMDFFILDRPVFIVFRYLPGHLHRGAGPFHSDHAMAVAKKTGPIYLRGHPVCFLPGRAHRRSRSHGRVLQCSAHRRCAHAPLGGQSDLRHFALSSDDHFTGHSSRKYYFQHERPVDFDRYPIACDHGQCGHGGLFGVFAQGNANLAEIYYGRARAPGKASITTWDLASPARIS